MRPNHQEPTYFWELRDLRLPAHLGVGEAERQVAQPVSIDCAVYFAQPPLACESDQLQDTVCYAQATQLIQDTCAGRSFQTLEHLHRELERALAPLLRNQHHLQLSVCKVKPPIPNVHGGVCFGRI